MRIPAIPALLAAALFALLAGYFGESATIVQNAPIAIATSSGLAVLPPVTLPAIQLPSIASTTTTSVPKKPKPAATQSVATTTPAPIPPPEPQAPSGDLAVAATEIRAALVNIICSAPASSGVQSISGSGVVIDPRGIILTNAHIGQYFLLRDRGVRCYIRTGSPATDAYKAAPIFISPAWINDNSTAITEQSPTGTGEHDITLLAITASDTNTPLPLSFPYAPLASGVPVANEPVVIGSYAAQFLQSSAILSALYPTIVYGSIKAVFTFAVNSVDLVSLGGSAAAQEGSSGGGAVDAAGNLTATITTSTTQGDTSTRELNAITAVYIRRDYAAETGSTLSTLLADNPSIMVSNFAPKIPALEAQITAGLAQ